MTTTGGNPSGKDAQNPAERSLARRQPVYSHPVRSDNQSISNHLFASSICRTGSAHYFEAVLFITEARRHVLFAVCTQAELRPDGTPPVELPRGERDAPLGRHLALGPAVSTVFTLARLGVRSRRVPLRRAPHPHRSGNSNSLNVPTRRPRRERIGGESHASTAADVPISRRWSRQPDGAREEIDAKQSLREGIRPSRFPRRMLVGELTFGGSSSHAPTRSHAPGVLISSANRSRQRANGFTKNGPMNGTR